MAAGSITWNLLLRTASLETDSKKAEKRIRELKKEAEALGKAMGAALVGGVTAATYALKQTINTMDETAKAAQKIGTTVEALVRDIIAPSGKPVLAGLSIGHVEQKITVPLGATCALDADELRLTILEGALA